MSNETSMRVNPLEGMPPVYMVKVIAFGTEYPLNDAERERAEELAAELGDGATLLDYVERIEQDVLLQSFAASIRRVFLFEGQHADVFSSSLGEQSIAQPEALETGGVTEPKSIASRMLVTFLVGGFFGVLVLQNLFERIMPEEQRAQLPEGFGLVVGVAPWVCGLGLAAAILAALYRGIR